MQILKKAVLFIYILTTLSQVSYGEIVDRIVAVVNDDPITQGELDAQFAPIYLQFTKSYTGKDLSEKLEEARVRVLHQLIEDRLIYQEAMRQEIPVSDEEIEEKLNELKSGFSSEEEFFKKMREQSLTLKILKQRFREQIAIAKIHKYQVLGRILISPKDIEDYYEEHLNEFTKPERAKVRTIMLRKNLEEEPVEATRQRFFTILEEYQGGASFSSLAEKYSEESHAADGGDLGFINRGEMTANINEAIFQCAVGQVTDIIESEIGFHIFLVEAKQEKEVTEIDARREEIHQRLFQEKAEKRLSDWIAELKEDAYISIR